MKHFIKILYTAIFLLSVYKVDSQSIPQLEKQLNNSSGIEEINILVALSESYLEKDLIKSQKYGEQALELSKKTNIPLNLKLQMYNSLGATYFYQTNYTKSVKYYEESLNITKNTASNGDIAQAYYNIALLYDKTGKQQKAENSFEKSLEYAKKSNNKTIQVYCYKALSIINELNGNFEKSARYLKQYIKVKDLSFNETQNILRTKIDQEKQLREEKEIQVKDLEKDTLKKAVELDSLITVKEMIEKQRELEKEISRKNQEIQKTEIARQKMRSYVLFGFVIFVIIIVIIIFRSYLHKKRTNILLVNKNFEIQQQKEEIETQNGLLLEQKIRIEESHKQITDSINYAKRIQNALLHIETPLELLFQEHFILYNPRDIVSGDFFWIEKIKNKIVVVAADCTGHGVPGAFMSMLGIALLNEQVIPERLENPGEILDILRSKVKLYLKQTGKIEESKDGMDMAMVIIDTEDLTAKYSGANNPLYVIRENNLMEYKSTRNPIGIYINEKQFEIQQIKLEKDDKLYLFSDGFVDQFGGEKGAKLKSKKFKELLIQINNKSMDDQKIFLEKALNEWKGKYEQVDDILVLGLKI
jgi:serine phosphatase RsbU (regulator of sigma subunit)